MAGTQNQPWLFDTPAGEQPAEEWCIAEVVFLRSAGGPFDYLVPPGLAHEPLVGCRVRVPLGRSNRLAVGFCIALRREQSLERRLKELVGCLDEKPLIPPSLLQLGRWIAEYYLLDWAEVLEALIPAPVRRTFHRKVPIRLEVATSVLEAIMAGEKIPGLTDKQWGVLTELAKSGPLQAAQLARRCRCSLSPIESLRRRGLIQGVPHRGLPAPVVGPTADVSIPTLNTEQDSALARIGKIIDQKQHKVVLIHGVTGSGKTELYIRCIEKVIQQGRQAIVLVPEISLTPQLTDRFRARFARVAILHSHLTDREREHYWREIAEGGVAVVIGARSAVFAPVPRLGIIVIDEEHEWSFKQETNPRYHAREVAIARGELEKIPVLLGSATPSLESWYRAQKGVYDLVTLSSRVLQRTLPPVALVDLREPRALASTRGAITQPLHQAIHQALEDGGQVILLLNRRGFATHIQCPGCGFVLKCSFCDIALRYHRAESFALCHYCNYRRDLPESCPQCSAAGIRYLGIGTQRLEDELRRRFPHAKLLRMDADAMQARNAYEQALAAFHRGDVQILLGTQMIAKGLDFPNVTLVGVISADTAIHLPDFRAAERTFQLLTQVAGRAGRGPKGGRVLIQTFDPNHPAVQAAAGHAYRPFAETELKAREEFGYPPFGCMARVLVRGVRLELAQSLAEALQGVIRQELAALGTNSPCRILGPAPCPLLKIRRHFRIQMQLIAKEHAILRRLISRARAVPVPEGAHWIHDIDPVDML